MMHADLAGPAVLDHMRDRFDVAIEQVDFSLRDRQPAAADNPGSPAADWRHLRRRGVIGERFRRLQQMLGVEWLRCGEIEADVVVGGPTRRGHARASRRARALQYLRLAKAPARGVAEED